MLKPTSTAGPVALTEIKNKEQDNKKIQINRGKKKLAQKSHKN